VISGNAPHALKMIRALRAAGAAPIVVATNPPAAIDSAATRDFAGMRYVTLFAADQTTSAAGTRFVAAFLERTGKPADHWGALGYDAATLIGRAVHETGSTDRRRVRDWIAGVGRLTPAHAGASGEIRFGEHGDPVNKRIVIRQAVQ
jgi:ABC-type branched-subunit amino acid transport system substrate-binding protein